MKIIMNNNYNSDERYLNKLQAKQNIAINAHALQFSSENRIFYKQIRRLICVSNQDQQRVLHQQPSSYLAVATENET